MTPIAALLGFPEGSLLDAAGRRQLGLDPRIRRASVARGHGTLRLLVADATLGDWTRRELSTVCGRVAQSAPHLLWMVILVVREPRRVVIAAPSLGVRVPALRVEPGRVLPSDAETLAALSEARLGSDVLVHLRWGELLGRDHLTRRFYRELERSVQDLAATAHGDAPESARAEIALLHCSRLLFLAFLQAKGWLDRDREFLRTRTIACLERGGGIHTRLLDPLFFGTLNTPVGNRAATAQAFGRIPFLNGGLFSRTVTERQHRRVRLSDDALAAFIVTLLGRYRLTAHEEQLEWSEAAVDPEMLGRAFESLMARDDRRSAGAFYTPHGLLQRVASGGLEAALARHGAPGDLVHAAESGLRMSETDRNKVRCAVSAVRVLDPSCGSGAFLVHSLERLAALAIAAGDGRGTSRVRREVLTRSLFGVDVNPTAVWLCELRLWLSVVIDAEETDPVRVLPLPNLDRNVRVGDALSGAAFDGPLPAGGPEIERLRGRYTRATGVRKRAVGRALDRAERGAALAAGERTLDVAMARRRDLLAALRARDLFALRRTPNATQARLLEELRVQVREARRAVATLRRGGSLPFTFASHFADVAARGGFDAVIGNPPWVRLHQLPVASRLLLRARYRVMREAAWLPGAESTGAGRGFAAQADLAALFIERSLALLRPGGTLALLVPTKLWRSLAGGGVRRLLSEEATVREVADWSEGPATFDAIVYPSLVVADRPQRADEESSTEASPVRVAVARRERVFAWEQPHASLALDASPGAPWLFAPPDVRRDMERLARAGVMLGGSQFGRPVLGVKSGCNDAFIVRVLDAGTDAPLGATSAGVRVLADGVTGVIEPALLRPLLRGEQLRPWRTQADDTHIVFPHDAMGAPLDRLPVGAESWLVPWRRRLAGRTDAASGGPWWQLFRTEAARTDRARVVWSDIGRTPRASVLERGDPTVPLNSCYVVFAPSDDDAQALAALLNAPPLVALLGLIAEPARGGYRRFLGWTVARLPLPRDWSSVRGRLADLGRAAAAGQVPDATTLTETVLAAYHLRPRHVASLLTWMHDISPP